jgi:hypothetical protein
LVVLGVGLVVGVVVLGGPNALDQSLTNKHATIRDDAEFAQLRASARTRRTRQRHKLRTVNNG